MNCQTDRRTAWGWAGLLVACLVAAADFGMHYGVSNQNVYLLAGLRAMHPGLWDHDWFAAHTYQYHHLFSALIPILARLGPLPWIIEGLNLLVVVVSLVALRTLFLILCPRNASTATLLLMVAVVAQQTRSVGSTYLYSEILQPSTLAVCGMLLAVVYFLRARYVVSGLFLALGATFHANYIILGILVFGLAHLAIGWQGLFRRGAAQLLPVTLVLLRELPVFLALASAPQQQLSMDIFTRIRAPHHYYPLSFLADYLGFGGWILLGLAAATPADRQSAFLRRLQGLQLALVALVTVSTLLTTVVFVPRVAMLFLLRAAPFSVLLAQILVVRAIIAKLAGDPPDLAGPWPAWRRRLWLAGLLLPLVRAGLHRPTANDLVLPLLLLGGTLTYLWWKWHTPSGALPPPAAVRIVPPLVAVPVLGAFLLVSLVQSTVLHGVGTPAEHGLYSWARTTSPDAVFLVPPGLLDFRLQSERAVVVDWKATPVLSGEVLEWYRRVGRITGDATVRTLPYAEQAYGRLRPDAIASLSREFGAGYAVFRLPYPDTTRSAFRNDRFVVLDLRPGPEAASPKHPRP